MHIEAQTVWPSLTAWFYGWRESLWRQITLFGSVQIEHPSCIPANDFHLLLHLKRLYSGHHFDNQNGMKEPIQKWLTLRWYLSMRRVSSCHTIKIASKIVRTILTSIIKCVQCYKAKTCLSFVNTLNRSYFMNNPHSLLLFLLLMVHLTVHPHTIAVQ